MLLGVVWLFGAVSAGEILPEVWKDIASEYLEREGPQCKGCPGVRELLEHTLPELNLTEIRLELFKRGLLERLGMASPPKRRIPPLPDFIRSGHVFQSLLPVLETQSASTQRLVLIPKGVICYVDSEGLNLKLNFNLPIQAVEGYILSGSLWLHGEPAWPGPITAESCGPDHQVVTLQPSTSKEGWFDGDVSSALQERIDCFIFKISWPEMNLSDYNCSVYEEISQKAFILLDIATPNSIEVLSSLAAGRVLWAGAFDVNTSSSSQFWCSTVPLVLHQTWLDDDVFTSKALAHSTRPAASDDRTYQIAREKRNVNCVEGSHECCREKLFVNFSKIGWDKWIIQPPGYEAYYCKGTCANVASISIGATPYHSVIKKLYHTEGNKLQITPCCTPTRLSPAQLIYMDVNGTFVQKTIPNLTVEECGCM